MISTTNLKNSPKNRTNGLTIQWYFKLSNSIKEKHEVEFAELELLSLFGEIKKVRNFADILYTTQFRHFIENVRIQDYMAHELPYGEFHGFYGETKEWVDVGRLVRRLAYTREFFVATLDTEPWTVLQSVFPNGEVGKNVQYFQGKRHMLFRFITNQYFIEKSQYISKLSRNEEEVDKNVDALFAFLTRKLHRIPASSTMQVGKRLEDYFAIREEPSLYLTHYMHPYKGKFHPKMARALLNYVYPEDEGLVMDNFAGSGTLLVEATLMGLDSFGVEVNPLSVLMSNVKCYSLGINSAKLKQAIASFLQILEGALLSYREESSGTILLTPPDYDFRSVQKRIKDLPRIVVEMFNNTDVIEKFLIAHELIKKNPDPGIRDFLLLGLSGTISDMLRRRRGEFFDILKDRLDSLYLRIYIFHRLNEILKIRLGKSETYIGDTRDMKNTCRRWDDTKTEIGDSEIDAIVNSPPYSTALDYIRNDLPQLAILEMADLRQLESDMIGNPNLKVYSDELLSEIIDNHKEYTSMPTHAKEVIHVLLKAGRKKEALRTYKFFKDMYLVLKEMYRVLKDEAKAVIIIGNNHYKLDGAYEEVKNDEVIRQMSLDIGFKEDKLIARELEKSMTGMIRYETILILKKP